MNKNNESFDYIMFAGKTKDELHPISSWRCTGDAIEAANRLLETNVYKYIEITYMPEADENINEIIWTN